MGTESVVPANKIDDYTHLVLTNHPKKTRFVSFRRSCELSTLIQKHDNPSELSDLLFIGQMCSLLHYQRLMRAIKSIFNFHAIKLKAWKRPELAHFLLRALPIQWVRAWIDSTNFLTTSPDLLPWLQTTKLSRNSAELKLFLSLSISSGRLVCQMRNASSDNFEFLSCEPFWPKLFSLCSFFIYDFPSCTRWGGMMGASENSFFFFITNRSKAHTRALRQKKLINFNLLSQCDFPTHKFEL